MWKKLFFITLSIISTIILGCKDNIIERHNVFVYELSNGHSMQRDSYSIVKDSIIINSKKYEVYKDSINDSSYYIAFHLLDSNTLLSITDTFRKIDSKQYLINNDEIIISKFFNKQSDSEYLVDYIFYNPDIGVISIYRDTWFRLDYIEHNSIIGLKEEFLKDLAELFSYEN